ncbi:ESX secretion-associated protein EspG [Mycobacterium kansasii]|uniref:ESX secretion-associated protein EspG n=1 Tax=Mycobacterium kansasii TaxID=1768 RepID=UPI000CDD6B8C|nr:ESX secretion-associated protein EspG [Mycobacterium kansasii]POX94935.1 hypothetical protein C3473_11170 [Mycobacterium kansasii]
MNAPVITAAEFNIDELLLLQKLLHVSAFPVVLEIRQPPHYFSDEGYALAEAEATESLTDKGVVADGECIQATVSQWIWVLQRPDVELAARIWRDDTQMAISVCRRGAQHVVAMRYQDLVTLQPLDDTAEVTSIAQVVAPVLAALGQAKVAEFEPINLLTSEAAAIDQRVAAGSDYAHELINAGAAHTPARLLSQALADRPQIWRSEIVAIEYVPGRQILSSAAVGIFDTPMGRIVAAPSLALDGTRWSTLAPGNNTRIVKSTELVVETLPSRSWFAAAHRSV